MSKHTIIAFRIDGDMVERDPRFHPIFITTEKDFDKIKSALKRWDENYDCKDAMFSIPYYRKEIVASNITDKQLEKFNLDCPYNILDELFKCHGMKWYYPQENWMVGKEVRTDYVDEWNSKGNKKWWNDFKEELEEAKYNPRNVLGKLEFDRRAEADGIIWKDEE